MSRSISKEPTLAVIYGNRDFFPDHLVAEARADIAVGIPDEETVPGAQADIFRHYGISMEALSEVAARLLQKES